MKTPTWMKIVIIVAMLPLLTYPWMMGAKDPDGIVRTLIWFFPLYVIATGICAWITYPQRPEVSWILIILLLLSYVAMYLL